MRTCRSGCRRERAVVVAELVAVLAVVSVLLALGALLFRGARSARRVAVAESNLRHISIALELYFLEHQRYPPSGSDLTVELARYVGDVRVFANPLLEEAARGETANALYREPRFAEIDAPGHYLTAMVSSDGRTAVILRSGGRVECRRDLHFDPAGSASDWLTLLDPAQPGSSDSPAVTYVVVRDASSTIKYEDATAALGENGAQETDQFLITIIGAGTTVRITTKAGQGTDINTLDLGQPGDSSHDALGFVTKFVGQDADAYTFTVSSVDNQYALGYIQFDFLDGEIQVEEGSVQVTRLSDTPGE